MKFGQIVSFNNTFEYSLNTDCSSEKKKTTRYFQEENIQTTAARLPFT